MNENSGSLDCCCTQSISSSCKPQQCARQTRKNLKRCVDGLFFFLLYIHRRRGRILYYVHNNNNNITINLFMK